MSFRFEIPFTRVWKDDSGMFFEGVASSTALDRQRERMSKAALENMCAFRGIDLLPSHKAGPLDELGTVEEGRIEGEQFVVMGKLDPTNPDAVRLFERLTAGKRYELSVGGNVTAAHYELEKSGKRVRVIDGVVLDHIAVTRPGHAANPNTWLQAIAKSAEDGDWPERVEKPFPGDEKEAQKAMIHEAAALLEQQLDELDKAGARHSRADIERIHSALTVLYEACGCEECAAKLTASAGDDEAENTTTKGVEQTMSEENVQRKDETTDVQKSDASVSFMENLAEEQAEQDVWEIMDGLWGTLTTTLRAILAGDGDKRALSAQAVADFGNVVIERVAGTPAEGDGAVTLSVAKSEPPQADAPADEGAADQAAEGEGAEGDTPPETAEGDVAKGGEAEGDNDAGAGDSAQGDGDGMFNAVNERLDRLEKALEQKDDELAEKDRQIEDLQKAQDASQQELAKAQERVTELEAQPAAGGPVNTAAHDDQDKAAPEGDADTSEDAFAKSVQDARERIGTPEAVSAQRKASGMVAGVISGMMFREK